MIIDTKTKTKTKTKTETKTETKTKTKTNQGEVAWCPANRVTSSHSYVEVVRVVSGSGAPLGYLLHTRLYPSSPKRNIGQSSRV